MRPDSLGTVQGRWQVGADGVQELLHADIRRCGTAQHRGKGITHGADPQTVNDLFLRQLAALQILLGQRIVSLGHGLHQLFPQSRGLIGIFGRDRHLR